MRAPYPPLEAYRRDVARLGGQRQFGAHDGRWVAAAVLLQRYAEASTAERRPLGAQLARYLAFETELTFYSAALQLAEEIEEAGATELAASWLALLERTVPADRVLDRGRIIARRARVARRLGDIAFARTLYAAVERLGEQNAEPELTVRAWIGFGVIAAEKGETADARRWYEAAALVADDTACLEQASQAHLGLMVSFAIEGNFERAIQEGWRAYQSCSGTPEHEAEILSNVAQVLLDSGRPAAATRSFAAVVARTAQPRILLGALGGAAMAAAAMGRRSVVEAAAHRIEKLARAAWPYVIAVALADLSDAFAMLGDVARAQVFRARAHQIATENDYGLVVQRASAPLPARPVVAAKPIAFGAVATRIVDDIESLDAPPDLCAVA